MVFWYLKENKSTETNGVSPLHLKTCADQLTLSSPISLTDMQSCVSFLLVINAPLSLQGNLLPQVLVTSGLLLRCLWLLNYWSIWTILKVNTFNLCSFRLTWNIYVTIQSTHHKAIVALYTTETTVLQVLTKS